MKNTINQGGYKHQIASRKEILDLLIAVRKPLSFNNIVKKLNYQKNDGQQDGLDRRLNAMVRDGQLLLNRKDKFGVSAEMDLVVGKIQGHPDGFGFLAIEGSPKSDKDLFVHFRQMSQVMHGDKVLAQRVAFRDKLEAKIIEVLEPANKTLIARFASESGANIGIPVNKRISCDITIPEKMTKNAKPDDIVVLEIIKQPTKRFSPVAKVLEILGGHLDPGIEIDVAIRAFDIPNQWSNEVLSEAKNIPQEVTQSDFDGRIDLTDTPLITIDGEDSQDFDDAVWCEPVSDGWRVLVAIADVSHYVPVGSALDGEAINRSTSIYFPEFVVPMLPESLSNGICSLNPDLNRCAMVCEMLIDQNGTVQKHHFFDAVIKSHARLTYTEVGEIFEKTLSTDAKKLLKKLPFLTDLSNLYKILLKKRHQRGALDFDRTETKIQFNSNKKIEAVVPVIRNDAHKMIEELMVAANVCAGEFITNHKMPALYRVHETPKNEKLNNLREFLKEFGLVLGGGDKPTSKDYSKVLNEAKSKPEFDLIQTVCLRSMNQAVYSPKNLGHFGLAHEVYAHFTSPIRRYPDLLVHRAIRHIIKDKTKDSHWAVRPFIKGKMKKNYHYSDAKMIEFGEICSTNERRADDATRDVMDWLKCEYMSDKVGETFSGQVASVTSFGLFVRLDDIHVDGLLHISALEDGYYHFNPTRYRLESDNRAYGLGDKMEVLVAKVSLDDRKINFALSGTDLTEFNKPKKKFNKKSDAKNKNSRKKFDKKPKK